ncbi:MAG: hypothetical protein ACI81P_002733 [Neolewinella sp.]|jgi:hypothetical protein
MLGALVFWAGPLVQREVEWSNGSPADHLWGLAQRPLSPRNSSSLSSPREKYKNSRAEKKEKRRNAEFIFDTPPL